MYEKIVKAYAGEETVYTVSDRKMNNQYIIERFRLPFLKVLYNPQTKKGKLYSFFSGSMPDGAGSKRSITKQDINIALKETIAWAKEHVDETGIKLSC